MILAKKRLNEILNGIEGKRILVIGDVMLDVYIWGAVERISPEAPVPVVEVEGETKRLGGAGNVAANVRAIGAKPILISLVGQDDDGDYLIKFMKSSGISPDNILRNSDRKTTVKSRIIAHSQQVVRVDRESPHNVANDELASLIKRSIDVIENGIDGVIISDYGKGVIAPELLTVLLPACREHNIFVAVDPKEMNFPLYRNISTITPNTKEAGAAVGFPVKSEDDVLEAGKALIEKLNADSVLITRGEEGMSLFTADGSGYHLPTLAREVFDVTGAGDTVISVLTSAYVGGATLREAAIVANYAAGVVVGELGAATVSPDDIVKRMELERERTATKNNR